MSKIKKILGITLSVLLILSAVPVFAFADDVYTSEDGYLFYYIEDGGAIIAYHADSISGDYTIPDTLGGYPVTSIGNVNANDANGFCGCSSLTGVTIPDSVTTIAGGAFGSCTSLESITIPSGVTLIGEDAFGFCTSLTSITVDEKNAYYSSDEYGVLFNKDKTELIQFPVGSGITSYSIPDSVTSIGYSAFCDCTSLESVTIPDSVIEIDMLAFGNCTSLESINIPDSVASIGGSAFYNTAYYNNDSNWEDGVLYMGKHLIAAQTSVSGSYEIKEGTKTIGLHAFYDCTNLASVIIPDSVISIGSGAFGNTSYYNNVSNWENGVLYIGNCLIDADADIISGSYEIKDGTRIIANNAFYWCDSLESITIPDSVTSIGDYAFDWCTALTSIEIPDSIVSIGDEAFENCTSLTSVTIPGSVASIDDWAFGYYTYDWGNAHFLIDDFTIYGYDNTAAETYANEYGITFISLGEYAEAEETTTEIFTADESVSEEPSSQAVSGGESSGSLVYVLIAVIIGMLVIAAVVVIIVLVVTKNNRNKTPQPPKYNGTYN